MTRVKRYYELVKPGIIYGNAVTASAGYILGARGALGVGPLLLVLLGLSLVIAGGCVMNNYLDRDLDVHMQRTGQRLFATGEGNSPLLLAAAALMALAGLALLATRSFNAAYAACAGFLIYVLLYTPAKRHTHYATLIGACAGATPPLVGYFAGGGRPDPLALALFLMLFLWQLPHFFAIALYRGEEYRAAGVPVLPLVAGSHRTKIAIVLSMVGFLLASALPFAIGAVGLIYLLPALALGALWLALGVTGFYASNERIWARRSFLFSLVVLLGVFGTLALGVL